MKKRGQRWDDKTPSEAIRLKTGAALNLLDLAAHAKRLAARYDEAERGDDGATRGEIGVQLVKLGGELAQAGWAVQRDEKRRKKR